MTCIYVLVSSEIACLKPVLPQIQAIRSNNYIWGFNERKLIDFWCKGLYSVWQRRTLPRQEAVAPGFACLDSPGTHCTVRAVVLTLMSMYSESLDRGESSESSPHGIFKA